MAACMHALQIPEIAQLLVDYASPDEPVDGEFLLYAPDLGRLQNLSRVCRAWRDAALRRYKSVDSFLWGGRAREGPDQGYFDGVHGRDFFSDKIQSGRVLSSRIKHFVLRLPSSGGVGIDQQNRPTLILAAAKPWNTFSSIMSFRMVFDGRFHAPNQILLVQEIVQQLQTLEILRLEGPDVGIIDPFPLELTPVVQHRHLQKLWLSNFTLRLTKAAAFSLQALAVILCVMDDTNTLAFLLHNSRDSLTHIHLKDNVVSASLDMFVRATLQPMCPQLETIVILEEGPSAPLPFRYEDEDTDEMLAACRSLRLYHVTESTLVPDPEHWPYLEMHISDGDGSREALRQDFPDVSYIVYLDDCIDCTPGRDAWRRYVPDRSPTMCVRCAKCRQDSSHPWAELAFYDMPFPPELVPPNYRRRS